MGTVTTLALPISALLAGIVADELALHIYKESNMNDVISLFAVPFTLFICAQITFIFRGATYKPAGVGNFMAGLVLSYIYFTTLDFSYAVGFRYTFSLKLGLEAAGILFSLVITEFIAGRKIRMERNALVVLTIVIAMAGFYVRNVKDFTGLIVYSTMIFIIFSIINTLRYIIAIAHDPVITILVGTGVIIIRTLYIYYFEMPYEFNNIVKYMHSNIHGALALYIATLMSVVTNFLMFRYTEIDIIFIFKCLHLILHVIYVLFRDGLPFITR
ncbi:hypothetical protein PAEPH01_1696 [Pancytospora epiphaga]|nr:hypothetical protein PAEPH01_1696 [Pancytospora epiphaga]